MTQSPPDASRAAALAIGPGLMAPRWIAFHCEIAEFLVRVDRWLARLVAFACDIPNDITASGTPVEEVAGQV